MWKIGKNKNYENFKDFFLIHFPSMKSYKISKSLKILFISENLRQENNYAPKILINKTKLIALTSNVDFVKKI